VVSLERSINRYSPFNPELHWHSSPLSRHAMARHQIGFNRSGARQSCSRGAIPPAQLHRWSSRSLFLGVFVARFLRLKSALIFPARSKKFPVPLRREFYLQLIDFTVWGGFDQIISLSRNFPRRVRGDCLGHHPVRSSSILLLAAKATQFPCVSAASSRHPSPDAVIEDGRCPFAASVSARKIALPENDRTRFPRLVRNLPETGS
jgi:hypothetical protein